jgi:hypothetical protein
MKGKRIKNGNKKRALLLVIGMALIAIGIGSVAGAVGAFQGKPEKIEARSAGGNLLIFRQGRLVDNVIVPALPQTPGIVFIRGRDGESAAVGMPPLVPNVGITAANPIPGGVKINLHIPTSDEIARMENEDQEALETAIGIVENQKGISVLEVRAHVMLSLENTEKIDNVELWITYTENGSMTFSHTIVNWDSKEITLFENINESGIVTLPSEVTMGMQKLNEMRSIAIQDNRIKEITGGGQNYILLPGQMTENEGVLLLRIQSISYRIVVDLENHLVKSIEKLGLG